MITHNSDAGVSCASNPLNEKPDDGEASKQEQLLGPATLILLIFIGVMVAILALAFCLFAFVLWLSERSVQIDSEDSHPSERWESSSPSGCYSRFPHNLSQTRFQEDCCSVDFTIYLDHVKTQQLRYPKESKLGRYWDIIMRGLTDTSRSYSFPEYLDVQTLRECASHLNHRLIIAILIIKARKAGLQKVAEVYLEPLTFALVSSPLTIDDVITILVVTSPSFRSVNLLKYPSAPSRMGISLSGHFLVLYIQFSVNVYLPIEVSASI